MSASQATSRHRAAPPTPPSVLSRAGVPVIGDAGNILTFCDVDVTPRPQDVLENLEAWVAKSQVHGAKSPRSARSHFKALRISRVTLYNVDWRID
jgi:hypothetical protein